MATAADAALIISLQQWGTQLGLSDAIGQVFAEGFDPERATTEDPAVWTLLEFGETLATLVKHGTLDRSLVLDLWWVAGLWSRVGGAASRMRDQLGEDRLFENFETFARSSA